MARRLGAGELRQPSALAVPRQQSPRNGHATTTAGLVPRPAALPRQQVQRIDSIRVRSVARVALIFYIGAFALMVCGIGVAWFGASQLGVVSGIERMMRSVGFQDFRLLSGQILLGAVMIAVVAVVMCVVLTLAAASLYNAASAPWGGVDVTVTVLADAPAHEGASSAATERAGIITGPRVHPPSLPRITD
jgi:transmembrane protein DUF3566